MVSVKAVMAKAAPHVVQGRLYSLKIAAHHKFKVIFVARNVQEAFFGMVHVILQPKIIVSDQNHGDSVLNAKEITDWIPIISNVTPSVPNPTNFMMEPHARTLALKARMLIATEIATLVAKANC